VSSNSKRKDLNIEKYNLNPNKCNVCKIDLKYEIRYNKTCSKKCLSVLLNDINTKNPNCGGETNYKKFIYKNIYMNSSWEVDIAMFMDENNIVWRRSKEIKFLWIDKNKNIRRYYPDFYLPEFDIYLDPKNKYLMIKDSYKLKKVIKKNNIKIISGSKPHIIKYLLKLNNKGYTNGVCSKTK
jgi:hypothetical protein